MSAEHDTSPLTTKRDTDLKKAEKNSALKARNAASPTEKNAQAAYSTKPAEPSAKARSHSDTEDALNRIKNAAEAALKKTAPLSAGKKTDAPLSAASKIRTKAMPSAPEAAQKGTAPSASLPAQPTTPEPPALKSVSKGKTAAAKTPRAPVYDEKSILHLEGLEHIRLRPGMYIGSLGDGSNENDGIYILLKEGIDNAVDEFAQGFGTRIDIEIQDNRVKIRDYGRGIPLGKLDDCVSNVNTGAKYNNSVFKQAIGMNGVGIKATNALSSYFRAASIRSGKMASIEYERGKKTGQSLGAAKKGIKDGTYLEFVPDAQLFGNYQFNMEMVEKRIRNYTYLNPGLLISCNGKEFLSRNGLADLLAEEIGKGGATLYASFSYRGASLQFVLTHTANLERIVYSFVNGQNTEDGGTHVSAFLDGFTKGVNDFFKKNYDQKDITGGLLVALKIGIDNPMFTSQTKNKLGNVEIRIPIMNETQAAVDDWLRRNPETAGILEDKIIRNMKARAEINNVTEKQVRDAAKTVSLKIPKLKDCRYHLQDGEKGADSMIFITEGDSATGSMVGSRDVATQAIFSLRGKPENMFGRKKTALFDNEELKNLTFALGVQKDVEGLRYNKIVIATDADNDGFHIRNLIMTYLLLYFEELVIGGHVFILETPLFRVRTKKETVYCYSEASRDREVERLGASAEVTRFKGLGEISPSEFGRFIHERKSGDGEDVGIHLTPVSIESLKNVPQVLEFYMGKNTPKRREFIVHHLAEEIDA